MIFSSVLWYQIQRLGFGNEPPVNNINPPSHYM